MDIISYFSEYISLSNEIKESLNTLFKTEIHSKGKILLELGNRSRKLIFIEKGLIRLYYQKDIKDITFLFMHENAFSMPIENIFYNVPSQYGWQVLEDCVMRSINYYEFE